MVAARRICNVWYAYIVGRWWYELYWPLRDNDSGWLMLYNFSITARNILLLLSGCPFVVPYSFSGAMAGSLHHQLFIHTWCIQSGGCSWSKRIICFVALEVCFLAHISYKILQGVLSHSRVREPTVCSVLLQWCQIEGIVWMIGWTQVTVHLEESHKASAGVLSVCMMYYHFWLVFATL